MWVPSSTTANESSVSRIIGRYSERVHVRGGSNFEKITAHERVCFVVLRAPLGHDGDISMFCDYMRCGAAVSARKAAYSAENGTAER